MCYRHVKSGAGNQAAFDALWNRGIFRDEALGRSKTLRSQEV